MTKDYNLGDIPRGTTPPIKLNIKDSTGLPYPLATPNGGEGCTIALAVRDEKWEDSKTDATAKIKRLTRFWNTPTVVAMNALTGATAGDVCWVNETSMAYSYSGIAWSFIESADNKIMEGEFTFMFTHDEMLLPVEKYYYSIDMKFPSGQVVKVLKGTMNVTDNTVNEI